MLREMGVLIPAIMVAGRSGSAFAAEIGVMQAREEIDALKVMGMHPMEVLVVPRIVGLVITLPLLTFFSDVMGLAGGAVISQVLLHVPPAPYLQRVRAAVEVIVDGKPVGELDGARKASLIGVLFQQGALFSSLSVAQNVMLPMREHTELPPEEREKIAAMKLELAGMPADSGIKFPSELSGGMIKRGAFARALALDPRILFLDEPTSDLDPLTASGIDALIVKLNQSLGITVVIITHDLTTLFTICGRIAVLVDN